MFYHFTQALFCQTMKLRVCKFGAEGNCSVSSIKEESVRLGSVCGEGQERRKLVGAQEGTFVGREM